jgi:hypothetical protein
MKKKGRYDTERQHDAMHIFRTAQVLMPRHTACSFASLLADLLSPCIFSLLFSTFSFFLATPVGIFSLCWNETDPGNLLPWHTHESNIQARRPCKTLKNNEERRNLKLLHIFIPKALNLTRGSNHVTNKMTATT